MCPLILCFLYFAVSRIRSSLYRFIDVFDAQMAVVDVGINFFLVSFNTFLMICYFCLLGICLFFLLWAVHLVIMTVLVGGGSLFGCMYGR